MAQEEGDSRIREWLGTKDAHDVLERAARGIANTAVMRGLSPTFLMKDPFCDYAPGDMIADVRSELVLFILENSSRLAGWITGEAPNVHAFLKNAFMKHWTDKIRTPQRDPRRYLYRRVREILGESGEFETLSLDDGKSTAFSMAPKGREIPCLCEEDLREIPFPPGSLNYSSINRKDVILSLAAHFYKGVSGLWEGTPVRVDLRDFVSWVGLHVPLNAFVPEKEGPGRSSPVDLAPDLSHGPEALYFDRDQVTMWGEKFANRLTARERDVFLLRHGEGLKLREIARKLGYRGSSGPSYAMECIREKLGFFLSDLPWLSPDDFRMEAFRLFMESVLSALKKEPERP